MTTPMSMTGYGSATVDLPGARYRIQVRSVNHRFLDLKMRLGRSLAALEPVFTARLKPRMARGHVEVITDSMSGAVAAGSIEVDDGLARHLHSELERLRDGLGISEPVTLADVLGQANVVRVTERMENPLDHADAFCAAFDQAVAAMLEMREREGAALARDLRERLGTLQGLADQLGAQVPRLSQEYRVRLESRLTELLGDRGALDAGRLELEVALLAERTDVSEELTRLASHVGQCLEALEKPPSGSLGKRLGFLTQELLREVNTVGSKIGDAELTSVVVEAKVELERIREQVANLE